MESERHLTVSIRDETEADFSAIGNVTAEAFKTLKESSNTEAFIIKALRAAGALAVSLVAELDQRIIGHIAFSPVTISDGTPQWYGLGPVSVLPAYQRQGVGKSLVREGLARLEKLDANGCCVVGYPAYYSQFGFQPADVLSYAGAPAEFFLVLPFGGAIPHGSVTFHEGFHAKGPQGAP